MALSIGMCGTSLPRAHFSIVIDPGHGGRDVGAPAGIRGRYEKEVALSISKLLANRLASQRNVSVTLTRGDDRFLSLTERRKIITSCKPNLAVSVHADSGPPSARGASVYVLNETGEAVVVGRLAGRGTNSSDDEDLTYLLAHLEQRASVNFAASLAADIHRSLGASDTYARRPRTANFAMLKSAGIPSILIETGFISNNDDATRLLDPAYQADIADAIAAPILEVARRRR